LAQSYRIRAEELRTLAEMDEHAKTKEQLIGVARDYDRMAETLEAIDRTNKTLHKARN
jgi:hypothetical protein